MKGAPLSTIAKTVKSKMSDEEKAQHKKEYALLYELFLNFLKNIDGDSRDEILYALMELRADLAISHAFRGFGIDEDEALLLLKNLDDNNLTKQDKDKRDRLVAAVNNLIDFAVCEEYQVAKQVQNVYDVHVDYDENYDIDFNNPADMSDYDIICSLYNDTYASVENADIEYAMGIAYKWIQFGSAEYLTYWTMNDSKVRPWHLALQGYTAKRDDFPAWMIPPIEWHCRCFLISASGDDVLGNASELRNVSAKVPQKPSQIDDTFSESVAKCGRIFGKTHSYFQVKQKDKAFLQDCVTNIKTKYYGQAQ